MDDRATQLAEQLEKLRRTLLALETYMSQVRDLIAVTQKLLDGQGEPAKPRRRPVRRQ